MKTLRVFYTDPDATDSSSSEENEKIPEKPTKNKRFLRQLTIDKSQTLPENTVSPPLEPQEKAVKKYPGVTQRPSGRYSAEIKHPISKRKVWLGTFDSAKQAYNAYCLKKLEFNALRNVGICGSDSVEFKDMIFGSCDDGQNGGGNGVIMGENDGKKMGEKVVGGDVMGVSKGVIRVESGKWGAMIDDPKTRKRVWLGSFDSVEEAIRVYKKKESEFGERFDGVKERKLSEVLGGEGVCSVGDVKRRKVVSGGGGEGRVGQTELKNGVLVGMRKPGQIVVKRKKVSSGKKISFKERIERIKQFERVQCGCGGSTNVLQTNRVENSSMEIVFASASPRAAKELPPGVRMTKSGGFGARVTDPVSGTEIWLGSYYTIEKAVDMINRKMAEFEKSIKSKKADCGVIRGSPTSVLGAENEISETSSIKVKTEVEYESIHKSPTSISEQVRMRNSDIGEGKSLDLPLNFDEAVKLGFMNEYGQLLGDYCECDESMWLSNHHVN